MTQVVDFTNGNNWKPFPLVNLAAVRTSARSYKPIPEFLYPTLIEHPVLAIRVEQFEGKPFWRFAGFINQRIQANFDGSAFPNTYLVNKERLYLDRWQLFQFKDYGKPYGISFEIPFWFTDARIDIREYIGVNYDSILDEFANTNQRILDNTLDLSILRNDVEDLLNR